jgi:hypothetical protein
MMNRMATLSLGISDDMSKRIREICRLRRCNVEEVVRDVLRRWISIEQVRRDAAEVRRFAQAAGFRTEEDILESTS